MKRLWRSSALLLMPLACGLALAAYQWLPWFGDADVPGAPGAADAPPGATAAAARRCRGWNMADSAGWNW